MDKYIGKYRVMPEVDSDGNVMEGNYIKCQAGTEIYRYDENTLVVYTSRAKGKIFAEQLQGKVLDYVELDKECQIFFDEMYIDEVAGVVKAVTKGKDIKPGNVRPYK
jgi:hypothetical protein